MFAAYHSEQAVKRRRAQSSGPPPDSNVLFRALETAVTSGSQERWFQVDVHSLFASPFSSALEPKVTVREVAQYDRASSPLVAVDADDPDVLSALERYLSLLSLTKNSPNIATTTTTTAGKRRRPTSMRVPSRSKLPPDIIDFHTPALSFMVRSKGSATDMRSQSDRRVRAVDLEAMVEAYLPHVYAELDDGPSSCPARSATVTGEPDFKRSATVTGEPDFKRSAMVTGESVAKRPAEAEFTRSPSESSVATLAEPQSFVPLPRQPALPSMQTPKRMSIPALRKTMSNEVSGTRVDSLMSTPTGRGLQQPRQLRASVSVMNLRNNNNNTSNNAGDRLGIARPGIDSRTPRVASQSLAARKMPAPVSLPRRRSEALSMPARDTLPASGPPQASRPRPLRASFSQQSTLSGGSRLASPRTSMLSVSSSRTSITTADNNSEPPTLRQWSSKSASWRASTVVTPSAASKQLGSLRNRKDMAPLTLTPVRRNNNNNSSQIADHASYASGSVSSTASSYYRMSSSAQVQRPGRTSSSVASIRTSVSQAAPASSAANRRRGISTGSHVPTHAQTNASSYISDASRFAPASQLPASRPQISGRRPDIRQVFAQGSEYRQPRRTTIAHQPPSERSAVRQRIGAKLSEFRSKLFSP
ncbi:hypothetical protein IWW50_002817 [Coemansia erecta]|nr:hypothetical protein IWW50_002817 [Coemansia erecta]